MEESFAVHTRIHTHKHTHIHTNILTHTPARDDVEESFRTSPAPLRAKVILQTSHTVRAKLILKKSHTIRAKVILQKFTHVGTKQSSYQLTNRTVRALIYPKFT